MSQKVYCVFNPAGAGVPRFPHPTYDSAKNEAKRLARLNPEQKFYVMESVGMAVRNEVSYYVHEDKAQGDLEDEIPF